MSRQQIGGQEAGAKIHPGIFVHLATEETAAVGALLTDDLKALHTTRMITDIFINHLFTD
ncbi:MAG: hypothetical protein A2X25_09665 [Chloroflexi bacterium GWB2_49_20]|nr:MAG: hypothetical protein A2X25_09665 [Chloroflexi bacterium GWB2_49_20]OGN79310.1 MAG: hypothetical protein A2X26_04360 [Chloroflexi bacterium GWC2_49_37]OGN82920.1 MAG: hypothetical protein A2X27_08335 [Chloroflexi bacterium GWD2_49_16]